MNRILLQIDKINGLLVENVSSQNQIGLSNGKFGLSIYFFSLARKTKNWDYQKIAENLIEEVYHSLEEITVPPDFEDGLAGIACGLYYLASNDYMDANPDEILSELDDKIYNYLIDNIEKLPIDLRKGLLGYLCYYLYRLKWNSASGDEVNKYIFKMMCTDLINQIGQLVEEEKIHSREPPLFTIFWDMPLLLILLADARKMNINRNRIDRILDYLNPIVTTLYPKLHSNRLYLLLGMENILKEISIPEYRTHADFLRQGIALSTIKDEECKNLDILVIDGISGLAFISRRLYKLIGHTTLLFSEEDVITKIQESDCWEDVEFYSRMKKNTGLCAGLSGIGLLFLDFIHKNHPKFV